MEKMQADLSNYKTVLLFTWQFSAKKTEGDDYNQLYLGQADKVRYNHLSLKLAVLNC